jgi:hypothetical protein
MAVANPFYSFVLGFGRDWFFQPAGNSEPIKVYRILTSSATNPCVITTVDNTSIVDNDNVVIYLHNGNDAVVGSNDGNWVATRTGSKTFTIPVAGLNIGTGGYVAVCNDGTGVTAITCLIKESHTENATINITKSGVMDTANLFQFHFSFTATDIQNLTPGRQYARSIFYTDADGNKQLLISDEITVYSR